jgi:hypothetical protein
MKISNRATVFILIALGIVLVAGISRFREWQDENPAADNYERPYERHLRMQEQAKAAFERAITNDVIGYQRTIEKFCSNSDDDFNRWWGEAKIDYVNRVGGVERTNIYYRFKAAGRDMYAYATTFDDALRLTQPK